MKHHRRIAVAPGERSRGTIAAWIIFRVSRVRVVTRTAFHHGCHSPLPIVPLQPAPRAESHQAIETIAPASAPLAGFTGTRRVPPPVNEPVKSYAPGSPEKLALKARLASMAQERVDIPIIIGGQEIRTGDLAQSVMPHDHRHVLADYHRATPQHVEQAIAASKRAGAEWANWAWEDRAAVFLRAAELLTTTWRQTRERRRRCSASRRPCSRPRSTRRAS